MFDNMTYRQRKDAALSAALIEGVIATVQVAVAMITGNASNWFAAMFCAGLGVVAWVILSPDEEDNDTE